MPTHFVRNAISNINVREEREFLPFFEQNRGGSRVGQRMRVIGSTAWSQRRQSFLARGRRALLDSALKPDPNHPLATTQLKFLRIFLKCLK